MCRVNLSGRAIFDSKVNSLAQANFFFIGLLRGIS